MIELNADSNIPTFLDTDDVFKRVLQHVIDNGYQLVAQAQHRTDFGKDDQEELSDLQTDLANAIGEAVLLLGFLDEETGPWMGELYDYAAAIGFDFSRTEDAEENEDED